MKVVSMRGEIIDVSRYIAKNANTPAVGNAKMNARGDIVGPGGKIIKKREQVAKEYYNKNPRAVKQVSIKDLAASEIFQSPADAFSNAVSQNRNKIDTKAEQKSKRKINDSDE